MKIIAVILSILLSFSPVLADPGKVAEITKGQKAPFSGVLMTDNVATKLYLDSKFSPAECEVKIQEKVGIENLQCKKRIDILGERLKISEEKYKSIIGFKNNRIDFLEKRWTPTPWYEQTSFWFSVGILSGVLLTVAAGYAVGQASK